VVQGQSKCLTDAGAAAQAAWLLCGVELRRCGSTAVHALLHVQVMSLLLLQLLLLTGRARGAHGSVVQ
jgi:hypothetical protein